ncbi:MAG: HAD-IA family hydrolase [Pyramidobacter sp.]|nr:HAD-IA family hydrolase [Pyramidobacter sp.]
MFYGKKYLFFDLDGTLIDSVGVWNQVDRELISHFGADEDETAVQRRRDELLRRFAGTANPYLEYCRALKDAYSVPMTAEEIIALRYTVSEKYLTQIVAYKQGVPEALRELKGRGFTLVLTTTTGRRSVNYYRTVNQNIIAAAPFDELFNKIYTREDVAKIKPDPEIFFTAMKYCGARPEECLVFEDSLIGAEAAARAGLDVAAVHDRYSDADREQIAARADWYFDDFSQVSRIVKREAAAQQPDSYVLELAGRRDVPAVFRLICARIDWMNRRGIRQWNTTDYLKYYPESYFAEHARARRLWVLRRADTRTVAAAAVLKEQDDRWSDGKPALYIHNLVSDERERGGGAALVRRAAAIAQDENLSALRLDCSRDNEPLNAWYAALGFLPAGVVSVGLYTGNKLEMKLNA